MSVSKMASWVLWRSSTAKRCFLNLNDCGLRLVHSKNSALSNKAKENSIKIGTQHIRYVTVGHGPHNLVCIPAVAGTLWTDFKPQLEGFDVDKFTVVSFDLPGFGKSTPPEKTYSLNFHENDADLTHELLKSLGIRKYSLLGWCYGGVVSMIYAAKYPDAVTKLVIVNAGSYILPHELKWFEKLMNSYSLSRSTIQSRLDYYGEKLLLQHWRNFMDAVNRRLKEKNGDCCTTFLKHIKCPTYILFGARDPVVDPAHAKYLKNNIKDSRVYIYPDGKHSVHLRYAEDFNKRVQDFLLEKQG